MVLGIELGDEAALAAVVDESGRVLGRGYRAGALGAAVLGAAAEAAGAAGAARDLTVGVAAFEPDGPTVAEAIAAIGRSYTLATQSAAPAGSAAIVAEAWCGAAQGARHAVCLLIGERTAAGILVDGQVWTGAHGRAGSAAWMALNPVERQDYRRFGCLDAEISARGIARRLAWRIEAGDRSTVLDRAGGVLSAITADHVFEGARARDGVAISVVRDTAKYLGMAIANLVAVLDPEVVILGGTVAAAGDLLLDPVRLESARRLSPALAETLRFQISPLQADAVAIGAARLAMTAGR